MPRHPNLRGPFTETERLEWVRESAKLFADPRLKPEKHILWARKTPPQPQNSPRSIHEGFHSHTNSDSESIADYENSAVRSVRRRSVINTAFR